MAQQQRPVDMMASGGRVAAAGTMSQQNLNQIVIEYLSKKGYSRTEAMLRTESAAHDADGRPLTTRAEHEGGKQWSRAMDLLRTWIDGVLDIYKPELRRLPWPIFVYSFMELVERNYIDDSKLFFSKYKEKFENEHRDDIRKLEPISLPEHLQDSEVAKTYRGSRYRLTLSVSGFYQLVQFLESKETEGGSVLLSIINNRLRIVTIDRAADDKMSLARMMSRGRAVEDFPAEDEGIPGHNPGSATLDQDPKSAVLTRLKLGPLPMEPELLGDVMAELEEEDGRNPPVDGQNSLVQEFEQRIKREESEEGPARSEIPVPPSLARDVLMEVLKVKENRDRFKIELQTGGTPPGISVCMFTFHNSHNGVNCIQISDDNNLVAVGTNESYIRVWTVDGKPLSTMWENEQPQASRRLIGHSAPVYNLSFSPAIANPLADIAKINAGREPSTSPQFLLSCSSDKTIRLWHLGLWQCLVIFKGHLGTVWDVTWGPFGHYFLTGSGDKTARLWSTEHIAPVRFFVGHDQDVDVVAFHPNSAYVFTGSSDKTVRMWLASNGYCVRMFTGHTGNITAMACAPNGKTLATADDNGSIILWDLAPGKMLKRMRGHDKGGIWSISWSAESNVLISGGADGTVRIWDTTKRSDAAGQGKVIGEGGTGTKMDVSGAQAQSAAGGGGKKKNKGVVVTADQIHAFPTKKSPVTKVKFTRMNLALAAGCYLP